MRDDDPSSIVVDAFDGRGEEGDGSVVLLPLVTVGGLINIVERWT